MFLVGSTYLGLVLFIHSDYLCLLIAVIRPVTFTEVLVHLSPPSELFILDSVFFIFVPTWFFFISSISFFAETFYPSIPFSSVIPTS